MKEREECILRREEKYYFQIFINVYVFYKNVTYTNAMITSEDAL